MIDSMKKVFILFLFCLPLLSMKVDSPEKKVYICTGPKAKVYHSTPKCKGLNKCSGKVIAVSLESVKEKRRACKICY